MTKTKQQYQFTTLEDVVKNEPFIDSINAILHRIIEQRRKRPEPPKGKKYKEGLYDRLSKNGFISGSKIAYEILPIEAKVSTLPKQIRDDLKVIYTTALLEFLKSNLPIQTEPHLPD
jgi:hypothetical protein